MIIRGKVVAKIQQEGGDQVVVEVYREVIKQYEPPFESAPGCLGPELKQAYESVMKEETL